MPINLFCQNIFFTVNIYTDNQTPYSTRLAQWGLTPMVAVCNCDPIFYEFI